MGVRNLLPKLRSSVRNLGCKDTSGWQVAGLYAIPAVGAPLFWTVFGPLLKRCPSQFADPGGGRIPRVVQRPT